MATIKASFDVARALAYRNDRVVKRYARQQEISEKEASQHFEELKRYLVVCATSHGVCAPSVALDEAWHAFVLHTRDYDEYCKEYLGRFIHHNPTNGPESDAYGRTRAVAQEMFGELNPELWPAELGLAGDCDSSCATDGYCSDGGS